jgi:hypothetical protein
VTLLISLGYFWVIKIEDSLVYVSQIKQLTGSICIFRQVMHPIDCHGGITCRNIYIWNTITPGYGIICRNIPSFSPIVIVIVYHRVPTPKSVEIIECIFTVGLLKPNWFYSLNKIPVILIMYTSGIQRRAGMN